jgi:phosphinothricin acetyltransferase
MSHPVHTAQSSGKRAASVTLPPLLASSPLPPTLTSQIMSPSIRPATADDLEAINSIYNHYVVHSTCTYQTIPSTAAERERWFSIHGERHPVIVVEENGKVIAWGSLSPVHERQAFMNSVEDSIYVHHEHLRRGIGRLILTDLLRLAKEAGHHTILGAISTDQIASVRLHESFGFKQVAHFTEIGWKFDRWLDLVWLQKMVD